MTCKSLTTQICRTDSNFPFIKAQIVQNNLISIIFDGKQKLRYNLNIVWSLKLPWKSCFGISNNNNLWVIGDSNLPTIYALQKTLKSFIIARFPCFLFSVECRANLAIMNDLSIFWTLLVLKIITVTYSETTFSRQF